MVFSGYTDRDLHDILIHYTGSPQLVNFGTVERVQTSIFSIVSSVDGPSQSHRVLRLDLTERRCRRVSLQTGPRL